MKSRAAPKVVNIKKERKGKKEREKMKIEYSECQPVVVHGSFDIFLAALMTISLFICSHKMDRFSPKEI